MALEKGGGALKRLAERAAYKALGPYARDAMKNYAKGDIEAIGRTLRNEGVVGGLPFKSYEKLSETAGKKANIRGKDLENYVEQLAADGNQMASEFAAQGPGVVPQGYKFPKADLGVDRQKIVDSMRKDLINPHVDIPGVSQANSTMEKLIQEFENGNDSIIPVLKAQAKKVAVGKEINWDRLPGADIPLAEEVQRSLYNKLKTGVEDTAQFIEENAAGQTKGKLQGLKKAYGNLKTAENISGRKEAREMAKNFRFDQGVGALGALGGFITAGEGESKLENMAKGASIGLLLHGARKYGPQITSELAERLGQTALGGGKVLNAASRNPWAVQNTLQNLLKGNTNGEEE